MEHLLSIQFWGVFAVETAKMFGWYALVVAILMVAEYLWPAGPQPSLGERANNFLIAGVLSVVVVFVNAVMGELREMFAALGMVGVLVGDWAPRTVAESIGATLLFLLCFDFLQYWFHRVQHRVPWLWFSHALHHDDASVNATTSMRHSLWHHVMGAVAIGVPITILCGPNLVSFYASMLFFNTYGFFNHANIRCELGWFGKIVSGPHWHRMHHGREAGLHNSNYAAFFPFIDILFGTYRAPAKGEYPETGIIGRPPRKMRPGNLALDVMGL